MLGAGKDEPPPRAACSKASHGTFWPIEANDSAQVMQNKASAGELWMCRGDYDADAYFVSSVHFFRWRRMTVRYPRVAARREQANTKHP